MKALKYIILTLITALLLCSCGKQPAQHKLLLENASPESSAMTVSCFDGENTTKKLLFNQEEEKRIISEINSLEPVAVAADRISEMTVPTYGIEITDKDGFDILLTYSNGLWLLKDGTVFEASYDIKNEFDKISENISTYPSGIYMTNSAYLAEYDIRYYKKAENLTCIRNGVSLSFISYKDNIVTVTIKNDSDTDFVYGTYFSLQKYIDGSWYSVPVRLSNYAFNDIGIILNAHDERQEKCDLTMYGELEAGVYRIEKEKLVAEFTVGMKTASEK